MCKKLFRALKIKMDNYHLRYELEGADEEIARLRENKETTDSLVEAYSQKCKKLEEENILLKSEKRISNAQLRSLENADKKIIKLEENIKILEQDKIDFGIRELEKAKVEFETCYKDDICKYIQYLEDRIKYLKNPKEINND